MRNSAVIAFSLELPDYIVTTGLLTDEITDVSVFNTSNGQQISNNGEIENPLDERILPELSYGSQESYASDKTYNDLQGVRTGLLQAIGQLTLSDTTAQDTLILPRTLNRVLRGELYALYGYTEVMLADFFCSGIPLSTLDFQHDFTYRAGSPRDSVYWDAVAKFDTALVLSRDSTRIVNLARVGLGRTYLDLGRVAAAADDVSEVPSDFQYQILQNWLSGNLFDSGYLPFHGGTLADREGGHGLPFLSSDDPRTADTVVSVPKSNPDGSAASVRYPKEYIDGLIGSGYPPITIASGIEARLIQAEAALHPGGAGASAWLTLLNELRQTASIPWTNAPAPDALPALSDPGLGSSNPDSARVALTFQERAAWLYLTGHRQGDLRRQLRQYSQYWHDQSQVYPTGPYLGLGAGFYGADVTAPIPANEYLNPLFHGCRDRAP